MYCSGVNLKSSFGRTLTKDSGTQSRTFSSKHILFNPKSKINHCEYSMINIPKLCLKQCAFVYILL